MKTRKWKAYGLVLLCVFFLCPGNVARAVGKENDVQAKLEELMPSGRSCMFEDGDIVGFIGDSITHVEYTEVSYQEFIYNYYITRYPQWRLEFRNLGVGSYTAEHTLGLYTGEMGVYDAAWEGITKAVIMLGMNEAMTGETTENYIQNIRTIVELLWEQGLESSDIFLVTPTPYDQTRSSNYQEDGQMSEHYDDLICEYVSGLQALAEELGTNYIDLHTPMLWVTGLLQEKNTDATLTVDDSIHPSGAGNVIAGFFFLYQQGAGKEVASVRISADGEVFAENAQADKIKRKGDFYVRFSYQPNSLPVAIPQEVEVADGYFTMLDQISQEILQIEGLKSEAEYTVYMNRIPIGDFTGAQLAQGVNVASCDWNPGQMAAKDMEVLNQEWHRCSAKYRAVLSNATLDEITATQEDVDRAFEKWREKTEDLRTEMYEVVQDSAARAYKVEIVSEEKHIWMGQELGEWVVEGAAVVALLTIVVIVCQRRKRRDRKR